VPIAVAADPVAVAPAAVAAVEPATIAPVAPEVERRRTETAPAAPAPEVEKSKDPKDNKEVAVAAVAPVPQVAQRVESVPEVAQRVETVPQVAQRVESVPQVAQRKESVPEVTGANPPKNVSPDSKDVALSQVMSFISSMAGPMSSDEHNTLSDLFKTGSDIIAQAEARAADIQEKLESTQLLQKDPATLFGIKEDGSIDFNVAADQVSDLLALFGGAQFKLSPKEKTTMHEIIDAFSKVFNPSANSSLTMDLEKIADQVTRKIDQVSSKIESHDSLLNPELLLELVDSKEDSVDTTLIADVAGRFMNDVQTQMEFAVNKIKELQDARK